MRQAIEAAARGADQAREMPVHQRMSILNRAAGIIADRHKEYARTIAREGIKTIREARKEVTRCIDTIRVSAEEARRLDGETISFGQIALEEMTEPKLVCFNLQLSVKSFNTLNQNI